jgi:hypothetical protein
MLIVSAVSSSILHEIKLVKKCVQMQVTVNAAQADLVRCIFCSE